ncbi:MAG: DUF4395 domain-containing protein [Acidimicrobiia bacterium]|nr:DUF4395 domain-containing protein [Acidimicrobiia bacterium]
MGRFFEFPNPVDEVSARLVASGVVVMVVVMFATRQWWILAPLTFGFIARVASGPRFSPLGLLVTRVIRPRLSVTPRLVPGPPKRFAQGMGVAFSTTASVLALAGATGAAVVVLSLLLIAASLEAFVGLCLGCKVFAGLMRIGWVPESACEACADLSTRLAA